MEVATRSTGSTKAWLALVATVNWNWDIATGVGVREGAKRGGGAGFWPMKCGLAQFRRLHLSPGSEASDRKHSNLTGVGLDIPSTSPSMSSYNSVLPTAARSLFSSCRSPVLRERSIAPLFLNSHHQIRGAKTKAKGPTKKEKKGPRYFQQKDLKTMEQFALCDAMRYIGIHPAGCHGLTVAIL